MAGGDVDCHLRILAITGPTCHRRFASVYSVIKLFCLWIRFTFYFGCMLVTGMNSLFLTGAIVLALISITRSENNQRIISVNRRKYWPCWKAVLFTIRIRTSPRGTGFHCSAFRHGHCHMVVESPKMSIIEHSCSGLRVPETPGCFGLLPCPLGHKT